MRKNELKAHLNRFEIVPRWWAFFCIWALAMIVCSIGGYQSDWYKPEDIRHVGILGMAFMSSMGIVSSIVLAGLMLFKVGVK